jgi:hypothetical protein
VLVDTLLGSLAPLEFVGQDCFRADAKLTTSEGVGARRGSKWSD